VPDTVSRSYTCPWCTHTSDGTSLTCPGCGVSIDVRNLVTKSGWIELPGRKDMAKIQFGKSSCQIEGNYVPVAEMNLAGDDTVYFGHHVLLWMDTQVNVSGMSLKGAWSRMLAGMPLIMTQAKGPGRIAFSRDRSGELIALPIDQGKTIDVKEHLFLVATGHVAYTWFDTGIWFSTRNGNETETHYPLGMFMDRFSSPNAPGLLILHAGGNAFVRTLGDQEEILIKPTSLLFKDTSVRMQLHFEYPSNSQTSFWTTWNNRHLWLRLRGPGRVAVQSAYEPMEDNGRAITTHSGASHHHW
jgi:uncharacterized protein (AIM24 family)